MIMKKQIFIAALAILLGTVHSKAQNKGDIELGIAVGGQFSMNYNNHKEVRSYFQPLESLSGGISVEYYISEYLGIKMKINYDPKGWSKVPNWYYALGYNILFDYLSHSLNYLTIPVLANAHFGTNKNWYVNIGPYVGFLLEAKDSSTFGIDLKNRVYKDKDFGLAYGIGYKFKVKDRFKLFFEVDVQQGITNVYKGPDTLRNFRMGINFGALYSL